MFSTGNVSRILTYGSIGGVQLDFTPEGFFYHDRCIYGNPSEKLIEALELIFLSSTTE